MKNRVIVAATALGAVMSLGIATAVAQQGDASRGGACAGKRGQAVGQVFDQLNLSADQKTRIDALLQSARAEKQALRSNESLTREQKRERMQALHGQNREQIQAILTPEQRAKLQSLMQNRGTRTNNRINDGATRSL